MRVDTIGSSPSFPGALCAEPTHRRWYVPRRASCSTVETYVLTFTITTSFAEWARAYDESLPLQKAGGITHVYRGVSKEDPSKVCAVMQAMPGVMDAFMADHAEMIAASGHVLESTVAQIFLEKA